MLSIAIASTKDETGFSFPQTDAGKRVELYFSAFNSTDENEMRQFMEQTGYFEADIPQENIASGYTRNWDDSDHNSEPRRNNIYTRPARGSSAGDGYSTVADLYKLVLALTADRLSAPEVSQMVKSSGIGIAGGAPEINATLETNPQSGFIIIVLSNYDPPSAGIVALKINSYLERLK